MTTFIRVQGANHENAAGSAPFCSFTNPVGKGRAVFVGVGWDSTAGDTVLNVTDDKGNSYTLVDLIRNTTLGTSLQTAYCLNVTNAPTTITATLSAASGFHAEVVIEEWSGVQQSGATDGHTVNSQDTPGTGADGVTSMAIVPAVNGDLIWGITFNGDGNGLAAGTGFTLGAANVIPSITSCTEYQVQGAAGSIAATFTANTAPSHCVTGVIAFQSGPNSFGDKLGTLGGGGQTALTTALTASGSAVVNIGDLIVFGGSQIAAPPTDTSITDNLGNVLAAQNTGIPNTSTVGVRAFWGRATVAGTITSISCTGVAGGNDWAVAAAVFAGSFAASPLDANPTNVTDALTPFTGPPTGVLAQAEELIVSWLALARGQTDTAATAPYTLAVNQASAGDNVANSCSMSLGYQLVAATTSSTPEFTAVGTIAGGVLGTMSFKSGAAAPPQDMSANRAAAADISAQMARGFATRTTRWL